MDPLSLTCNIGAVITITAQLISVGSTYGSSVANFPKEIEKLIIELTSLSEILNALKTIIDQPLPRQDDGVTDTQPMMTVQLLSSPFEEYEKSLQTVLASLEKEKAGNKVQKMLNRAVWPLKEADTKDFFMRLERYKKTFTLALSADEMVLTRSIQNDIGEIKRYQRMERETKKLAMENERFREVLSWVSAADPGVNHVAARGLQQAGTGKWFMDRETYRNWLSQDDSFLWLYGIPGAGKTILTSMIIDRVMSEIHTSTNTTPAVVYFYFDFKESSKRTTVGLLGSLVAQLVQKKLKIPDDLEHLYQKSCVDRKPPEASYLEYTLHSLIKQFSKVVVIIDALDECVERDSVLEKLRRLQGKVNLNLLVTSREEQDIKLQFENLPSLSIKEEDISVDIETFVTSELIRQPKLQRLKQSTKLDIISSLTRGANGMFRWAKCCLDEISKLRTDRAIKAALKTLPPTLEASYERILCQIPQEDQIFANRILHWLLCSFRPMSLLEVVDAISVEVGDTFLDPDSRLNDPKDVLHICGGLVQLNDSNMTVGLAHFTVEEYLLSTGIRQGPAASYHIRTQTANAELTRTCLTYILFTDFDTGPYKAADKLLARLNEYPLLRYAPYYWMKHIRQYEIGSDEILDDLVLRFFLLEDGHGKYLAWLQIYHTGSNCKMEWRNYYERKAEKPLYFAAKTGQHPAVKKLFECGANINEICGYEGTPLVVAASGGDPETVQYLLEKGTGIFEQGIKKYQPLNEPMKLAAVGGFASCVKLLLTYGTAETSKWIESCQDSLGVLFYAGHENVMEVFLEADYFKQKPSPDIMAPFLDIFISAVYQGWWRSFHFMFEMGFNVIIMENENRILEICLRMAIEHGHVKILNAILQKDLAKVFCTKHDMYKVYLQDACYYGQAKAVEYLLAFGYIRGSEGMGISLHIAAAKGHISIIERLLRAGASPLEMDDDGWSPLAYASYYREIAALEKLSAFTHVPEALGTWPGPTSWEFRNSEGAELSADGLEINGNFTTRALRPIDPLVTTYSFEVEIIESSNFAIGFGDHLYSLTGHGEAMFESSPGQSNFTWGYYSWGEIVFADREDKQKVECYGTGDIVGCHFNRTRNIAFFTVNGKIIGKPISDIKGKLVPMISSNGSRARIRTNFGDTPLVYPTPSLSSEALKNSWKPSSEHWSVGIILDQPKPCV